MTIPLARGAPSSHHGWTMTTTVPASSYADSEAPTHPLVVVTPLMRSALDNGVEPADLEQWACAGGDDNRRSREAARLMGGV